MKYKVIASILALLGFGSSCSTVKQSNGRQETDPPSEIREDSVEVPQIRLMYGVPRAEFRPAEAAPQEPVESAAPTEERSE